MRFRVLASDPGNFDQWAARERLLPTEFKPPRTHVPPACVLATAGTNLQLLICKGRLMEMYQLFLTDLGR